MKILLSFPSESQGGDGRDYARVYRRLGHEVREVNVAESFRGLGIPGDVSRGYPAEITIEELFGEEGVPGLFFYVEPLGLIPRGLERCPAPTACIVGDPHRGVRGRRMYARLFDHVFVYQRNYLHLFGEHPPGAVHWLPNACDTEVVRDLGVPRDLDVAQIGRIRGANRMRGPVMAALAEKYKVNEQRFYLMREIPEVYSRAKIVVNIPMGDDLNIRFFEALSCGALLLTRRDANGQEELFQEGVHYAAYGSERELFEKVDHYLRHGEERERIAAAGRAEALRRHTLEHRV
ncbi:MAG: glycosyltransferase, partial [Nitrospinota bacterium]